MSPKASASLDRSRALPTAVPQLPRTVRIFASVDRSTGPLLGIDGVRIDAASGSLMTMSRLRRRYLCPAILDLPGAGTGPVCSPLTTSELLVFASAERFDWVSLRGVTNAESTRRARALLHPSVRLAATVSVPAVLEELLPAICVNADALVLNYSELLQSAGVRGGSELMRRACEVAALHGIPCMILGGLLGHASPELLPTQSDVERLDDLVALGSSYFVLDMETRSNPHAQAAVDAVRLVVDANTSAPAAADRFARVLGRPTLAR